MERQHAPVPENGCPALGKQKRDKETMLGSMSRMDSRPMCSEDTRGPPTTAASEDRRGGEGFLDEVGLELDKWNVEKQEGKHATWEEKHGH